MSMSPQLAVAAMPIAVLLPSEGRGGRGARLVNIGGTVKSPAGVDQLTLLLFLGHDAIDFVRFRNVEL